MIERIGETQAALAESSLTHDIERVGGWTKAPDTALGEVLQRKAKARVARVGRKARTSSSSSRSIAPEVVAEFTSLLSNQDNLSHRRRWRELRRLLKARRRGLD